MHDPRGKKGLSLAYALSPTGADHMEAPHDPLYAGFHPKGHPLGPLGLIEPLDPLELDAKKVHERNNTLARLFNTREGFTPADDVLPDRLHEGIGNGALKGERIDRDQF